MSITLDRPRRVPFRVRLRARLIRLALLLSVTAVATASIAGCSSGENVTLPGAGPLLTVEMRGGMCMDGGVCESRLVLERDGLVHDGETPRSELGRVSADAYAVLDAAIRSADFAALKARPFTGECPIAFDGQEQIFAFSVGSASERLASCEVEIDWTSALFIAVANALGEWVAIPLF